MFGPEVQTKILAIIFLAAISGACGKANPSAPTIDPVRGKHPASWVYGHRAYYQSNKTQCNECHGSDQRGGITRIDCFNQSGDTRCHQGGHAPRLLPHAIPFLDKALHGPAARVDLIYCQACHGEPGVPETTPPYPKFNLSFSAMPRGCETCHPAGAGHPAPWPGHRLAGGDLHACGICHGSALQGGSGDRCAACHTSLTAGAVPTTGQCISCHGKPPNGAPEAASPNKPGAHATHGNITEITGKCESCHSGAGTGTLKHADGQADVSFFMASYNAKTGAAFFNISTFSCTNVSCHGGKETPRWDLGSIDTYATEGCRSCHSFGRTQFNSFSSGKHKLHYQSPAEGEEAYGIPCTECHNASYLETIHFTHLSTAEFDVPPKNTIRSAVGYNGATCLPSTAAGSFAGVCHIYQPTVPRPWQ